MTEQPRDHLPPPAVGEGSDKLVERLRSLAFKGLFGTIRELAAEAADTIDELKARAERAEAELAAAYRTHVDLDNALSAAEAGLREIDLRELPLRYAEEDATDYFLRAISYLKAIARNTRASVASRGGTAQGPKSDSAEGH